MHSRSVFINKYSNEMKHFHRLKNAIPIKMFIKLPDSNVAVRSNQTDFLYLIVKINHFRFIYILMSSVFFLNIERGSNVVSSQTLSTGF